MTVQIQDPTTFKDLMSFMITLMIPLGFSIIMLIFSHKPFMKMIAIGIMLISVLIVSFIESNREYMITNNNVNIIEQAYNIHGLKTTDRMGIDPGAGTIKELDITYADDDNVIRTGTITMNALNDDYITAYINDYHENANSTESKNDCR